MDRTLLSILFAGGSLIANAVTVNISVNSDAYCVYPTGSLCAEANGGVGPYTYQWSTGNTGTCIYELTAGTYSVTVTDGLGDVATDQVTLQSQPMPGTSAIWLPRCPIEWEGVWPQYKLFGQASIYSTGVEPFTTDAGPIYYLPIDEFGGHIMLPDLAASGEPLVLNIVDGNGCTSTLETITPFPPQYLAPQVLDVEGACSGGANGRVRVFVPAEPSGWKSAFKLFGPTGYRQWSSTTPSAFPIYTAGDVAREYFAQGLPPGTYHLVQHTSWEPYQVANLETAYFDMIADECPDTLVTFEVPDLGFTCGTLSGRVFIDPNENCTFGSGDVNLTNTVVEVQPGDHYALTNATGQYSINLPYGTYTVADQNPLYQEHCGVEGTPFTISAGTPNVTRNLADTSLTGLDVSASMSSSAARPGFEVQYAIRVRNLTGVNGGNGTVSYTYDPTLTYLTATPAPASIVGNTITWNFTGLTALSDRHFWPRFQVPPDIGLLGTELTSSATVTMVNTEANTTNNSADHSVTITGAYDPNDKLARTSSGNNTVWYIGEDEWIDYTIRFQNTGTDTAFFVVITDTLPTNLDPATFEAGASSHTHSVTMRGNGILRWMFPNILLPDSNVNEPRSHGFVSFRIRPRLPLLPGTEVTNIANIYFDFNPPVITEPSVLVAEFSTGVEEVRDNGLLVFPNPAGQLLTISEHGGAGLVRIEVHAPDGRLVLTERVQSDPHALSIAQLAPGAYRLLAVRSDGTARRTLFIKQ
ncbi:MAG: DUF11 domain-containing protein [Flavobacteriales bacterium]|nr:DUF11 domain-containing protein [Flavobacteriales bacterium]